MSFSVLDGRKKIFDNGIKKLHISGKPACSYFVPICGNARYKKQFLLEEAESVPAFAYKDDLTGPEKAADAAGTGPDLAAQRRRENAMDLCECMIDIAAEFFNVPSKELRRPGRTSLSVSRVRQVGMYVAHVGLGLSMTEVGRGFGRDRTTVQHACQVIEDMRDDQDFDLLVAKIERIAAIALRNRIGR